MTVIWQTPDSGQPVTSTSSDLQNAARLFIGFGQMLGSDTVYQGTDSGLSGNSPNGYAVTGNLGEYGRLGAAQSNQQQVINSTGTNGVLVMALLAAGAWFLAKA